MEEFFGNHSDENECLVSSVGCTRRNKVGLLSQGNENDPPDPQLTLDRRWVPFFASHENGDFNS
jgi:hypothetical protein